MASPIPHGTKSRLESIPMMKLSKHSTQASLHHAVRDNRHDDVEQQLTSGYVLRNVLNSIDSDGYAPIHYAAKFNRFKIMTLLVSARADVELQTEKGKFTPLHLTARYQPRYHDDDIQKRETEEDDDATDSQNVEDVSYLASSKKATKFLIRSCNVDVNSKAQYGITPLHLACQHGNKAAVAILLKCRRIKVNIRDDNMDTPLHKACEYGETEIVDMLLRKIKDGKIRKLYLKNNKGETPLHNACREGHADIVKLVLKYGSEQYSDLVSAQNDKSCTPLHLACENGNEEIVHTLLHNEANLLQPKRKGITPIHIAARSGFVKVVETLMKSNKEIINSVDMYQQTPIHSAARFNQPDMIDYLLDIGADIESVDVDSYTPLMTAAAYGQTLAFKKLLERGARPDVIDKNGKSIVFLAAEYNHVAILKTIVADPKGVKLISTPDATYNTPLHIAAQKGHLSSVRFLISSSMCASSIKLDAKNELNKTPLHLAAENGHVSIVRELIQRQNNTIFDEDEDGNTPLHLACIHGYRGVARVLLNAKADIESRNTTLWSPLYCAANNGHEKIVELLIDSGADFESTDRIKTTPLHLASQQGHLNVVNIFLKHKADVGSLDPFGYNALDLAIENSHEEVAMAIVRSERWKTALRNTTRTAVGEVTTPLRKLIRKMPDVAKQVFDQCTKTTSMNGDNAHLDSQDYAVTFDFEFLEDYRDHQAEPSRLQRLTTRCFNFMREGSRLSVNISEEGQDDFDGGVQMRQLLCHSSDHPKKDFSNNWGPYGFDKRNHPLSIMVKCECTNLLKHPLIISLLQYKWSTFGRVWFYGNLIVYLVFLIFLTLFALLLPNPQSNTCVAVFTGTFGNASNLSSTKTNSTLTNQSIPLISCENYSADMDADVISLYCGNCDTTKVRTAFLYLSAIIVEAISLLYLAYIMFQTIRLRLSYMLDVANWIATLVSVISIIFAWVFHTDCLCPRYWQWQVGAACVFLAWFNLIFIARKLPRTGIYVLMLQDVFFSFLKMVTLSLLLVVAFSLAFYMAFFEPGFEFSRSPFASPGRSIVKTITMTTGEFDFDEIFRQTPGGLEPGTTDLPPEIPFLPISFLLWIIFIIFMPILLTNLLVGLAVDDIKAIQEAAQYKRLALKVDVIVNIEQVLPTPVRRHLVIGSQTIYSKKQLHGLWKKFCSTIWRKESQLYDSPDIKALINAAPKHSVIEEMQEQKTVKLTKDLKKLRETVNELREKVQVLDSLENYIKLIASKQGITSQQAEERESEEEQ